MLGPSVVAPLFVTPLYLKDCYTTAYDTPNQEKIKTMKKYNVYAIGNAIVDKEFETEDQFLTQNDIEKGLMTLVEEDRQNQLISLLEKQYGLKKQASGGSAANTIIATQYFGGQTFLSCKVAADGAGDFYCDDLKAAGVDTNLSPNRDPGTTGQCIVMVTPDAERTMNTFLGVAGNISPQELVPEALIDSEYLYIEGYLVTSDSARKAAVEAITIAKKNGVKVALTLSDPSMVEFFKDGMNEIIADGVDLLFCNEEEALTWTGAKNLELAAQQLKEIAQNYCITLGAKGALIFDGKETIEIAPHKVQAIDSNGAGDMFAGAYLYGISHGMSTTQAGNLASRAASVVVSQFGPRLTEQEYKALLKA